MVAEGRKFGAGILLIWRIVVVVLLLGGGVMLMRKLAAQKKPPAQVATEATVPIVDVVSLAKAEEPVTLSGFGVVRAGRVVEIVPEVAGQIVWRADLEVGDRVAEGAALLRLDKRDYEIEKAATAAQRERVAAEIRQWQAQLKSAGELLAKRRERAALSAAEATRLARLWDDERIGTQTAVDAAKRAALADDDAVISTEELLAVLPHRIAAAEAQMEQLVQQAALSELRIARCEVRSPFAGRVERFGVELGGYAAPGMMVAAISDDADRDLPVSLRADEVAKYLPFAGDGAATAAGGWYAVPTAVTVQILDPSSPGVGWEGQLKRIARVDPGSRMVEVVVKPKSGERPLPAGTFCEVRIPGKTVHAFRVPRVALRSGGKVFVAAKGTLSMRAVEILHADGDWLLVDGDLAAGDDLIVGRMMAPVSGMAVRVRDDAPPPTNRPEE